MCVAFSRCAVFTEFVMHQLGERILTTKKTSTTTTRQWLQGYITPPHSKARSRQMMLGIRRIGPRGSNHKICFMKVNFGGCGDGVWRKIKRSRAETPPMGKLM